MVLAAEITKEVIVPEGVTVTIEGQKVTVKGPKGEQNRTFEAPNISIKQADKKVILNCKFPKRQDKAVMGSITGHIANLVTGVNEGFTYHMRVYYSHFPVNVSVQGNKVIIKNFLGEKHPRESMIVGQATKVTVKGQDITIDGINKEDVGQTSGNLQLNSKIGRKDPRVFQDGIFLVDRGEEQ